jgi:hypothetical protein
VDKHKIGGLLRGICGKQGKGVENRSLAGCATGNKMTTGILPAASNSGGKAFLAASAPSVESVPSVEGEPSMGGTAMTMVCISVTAANADTAAPSTVRLPLATPGRGQYSFFMFLPMREEAPAAQIMAATAASTAISSE